MCDRTPLSDKPDHYKELHVKEEFNNTLLRLANGRYACFLTVV